MVCAASGSRIRNTAIAARSAAATSAAVAVTAVVAKFVTVQVDSHAIPLISSVVAESVANPICGAAVCVAIFDFASRAIAAAATTAD